MRYIYVCGLLAAAAAAQAGEYRPPRLADGQVDLQGVWSHKNITPLERPAELKSFVITREEAAQLQARILAKSEDLSRPAEPSVYFWDRGVEAIRGEYRSSIITDPADGKIPGNDHFKTLAKAAGAAVLTAFDGPEARPGSERCLTAISAAPPVTVVPAADLRQIVQTPQCNRHRVRGAARSTCHSHECAARAGCRRLLAGRFDRLVGRRDAGDRDEVLRADQRCARRSGPGVLRRAGHDGDRAHHSRVAGRAQLRVHGGRPHVLHATLEGRDALRAFRRADARIRLPRG